MKCACCANVATEIAAEHHLCAECFREWIRDERFSERSINASLGQSSRPEDFTKANHERYLAEAYARTAAWVLERTARAA